MKKSFLITAITILITVLCTGCGETYKHISQDEALKMMKAGGDYVIVDVRTKEEYDKRHIPGSILLPITDIKEGKLDILPDKNQTILIYCWTGRRAADSANILYKRGYKNVYEFGGLVDWTGDVEGDLSEE